jgi:phage/plasmid-like protein (TIGR03299 family)
MSHEFESGLFVRQPAWHNLGTVLNDVPSIEEAYTLSGLDWTVSKHPVQTISGLPLPDMYALIRDKDQSVLNIVSSNYKPVQNIDNFEWLRPFLDNSYCTINTAGSLKNGGVIWILCKLQGDDIPNSINTVNGEEELEHYLCLVNSHDGSSSWRVYHTTVRVVCMNTLNYSLSNKANQIRLYHNDKINTNMELAKELMLDVTKSLTQSLSELSTIATYNKARHSPQYYIGLLYEKLYGKTAYMKAITDKDSSDASKLQTISELVANGMGNKGNTIWDVMNGYIEYLDFYAHRNSESTLNSMWFGKTKSLKEKLYTTVTSTINSESLSFV